ncbi:MAG TPA: hypothetical protein VK074_00830, partial [Fodinibius sp.]|nr:hypothetical protein [Fodinibius sp.]
MFNNDYKITLKRIFPLYWAILLFPVCSVTAQHTTIRTSSFPPIQNFSDDDYDSYIQNWGIAQDTSGIIYVANLGEVLQYDGVRWQTIQVENQTALSIGRGSEGKLYVGGLGSFGYLDHAATDTTLSPTYYSLADATSDSTADFSNVWNILFHNESVYFDTQEGLYRLKNEHISNIKPENLFRKAFKIGNNLLVSEAKKGLFFVNDDELTPVGRGNHFLDQKVMVVLPHEEDQWLIADRTRGLSVFDGTDLMPLQSEADTFLINNDVYTGIILPDTTYLLGTLNDGIVHLDKEGRLLRKIDSKRGLIGDQVHSLFLDKDHNVWVALGNGLSLIEPMSSVSYLDERNNISGIVYDLQAYEGYLYASTNEGLFRLDIQKNSGGVASKSIFKHNTGRKANDASDSDNSSKALFKPLLEDSYRCKDIIQYGEGLIVDCSHSVYLVSDNNTVKIAEGFDIQLIRGSDYKEDYYYVLGREGFRIFDSSHKPIFKNTDFGHVFNSLVEEDNGDVWIGTETNGVFRLEMDFLDSLNSFKSYLHHYNVPHDKSDRSLRVFHIDGEVIIASASGLFSYNEAANSLVREHRFGEEMA